jgi:hypothetical protein
MNDRWTITAVQPLDGHRLRLMFGDGAVHEVDLSAVLALGGVFAPIFEDRAVFESVRVDEFGTIAWPGEVDLDPIVLRGDEAPGSGATIPRLVVDTTAV